MNIFKYLHQVTCNHDYKSFIPDNTPSYYLNRYIFLKCCFCNKKKTIDIMKPRKGHEKLHRNYIYQEPIDEPLRPGIYGFSKCNCGNKYLNTKEGE